MSFDPKKVKCVNDSLFLEVFFNETTEIMGPAGSKIQLDRGNKVFSEPFALVHSAGPSSTVQPGEYVLIKPGIPAKGGYEVNGKKYAFFSNYEISAVIPEEYKEHFSNDVLHGPPVDKNDPYIN